ncbi:MAG TPA: ATP-binding protein [Spirochaetota bacterium]|nr:ATP-binding protein [Spirochaetota bacterium]
MMDIAIASGKGGTGKTLMAVSLASWCAHEGMSVALLDCDVEEPNADLFLKSTIDAREPVNVLVPRVDDGKCTGCGECEKICAYSAIVLVKGKPLVLDDMCHSCGGCYLVCPERAITEVSREIGAVSSGRSGAILYAGGLLNIGEPMSPPAIRETKRRHRSADIRVIDCPPGTSCPVIESVRGSTFVVLVTEPTPFGLNDLALAVEMCRAMELPFGVVINRDGIGDGGVREYCAAQEIPVIAAVPYSRELAESYAKGDAARFMLHHHADGLGAIIRRAERFNGRCVLS